MQIAGNIFVQLLFSLILQYSIYCAKKILGHRSVIIIVFIIIIIVVIIIIRVVIIIIIVVVIIAGWFFWWFNGIILIKLPEEVLPPGVEHSAAPGGSLQGVDQPIVWADGAIGASSSCLVLKVSILLSLTLDLFLTFSVE